MPGSIHAGSIQPGTDKIQTRKVREGFLDLEIGSLHDLMELL